MFLISIIVEIIINNINILNIKIHLKLIFIIKINGKIIINSISNKIKIIKIYIKFIFKLIFLLLKLLNPHSILFKLFLYLIKLLIKYNNILIIKIIIII